MSSLSWRYGTHLARRFGGSLWPGGPPSAAESWATHWLGPGEREIWTSMSGPDRRHAVGVARRLAHRPQLDGVPLPRPVMAAALLHDAGKVSSGLGTFGRVGVTLAAIAAGRERIRGGRAGRYLRHDELGAELLALAGSDPFTVAWAREHHLPAGAWSVDRAWGEALKAADDD